MKYVKIRITLYRDRTVARSQSTQKQLAAIADRERALIAKLSPIDSGTRAPAPEVDLANAAIDRDLSAAAVERAGVLAVEEAVAKRNLDDAQTNGRSGTFGYQEINDEGTLVVAVLDDDGNELPLDAAYEYEIVDTKPPTPKWAAAREIKLTGSEQ